MTDATTPFDCEAFYDLCQTYRHMSVTDQDAVTTAYKQLQAYCAAALREAEGDATTDAARYRWLRQHANFDGSGKSRLQWYLPRLYGDKDQRAQLDDAIDGEIQAAARGGGR